MAEKSWADTLVFDLVHAPIRAVSRTVEPVAVFDFDMIANPLRACAACWLVPPLCFPVAALGAVGLVRCFSTMKISANPGREAFFESTRNLIVHRRRLEPASGQLVETIVADAGETERGLRVAGNRRDTFVDDPRAPGTAYLVIEQSVMKFSKAMTVKAWYMCVISDVWRFGSMIGAAAIFVPSARRLLVDLRLVAQRRLKIRQIRHPILNFRLTAAEYSRARIRVNVNKPQTRAVVNPWKSDF